MPPEDFGVTQTELTKDDLFAGAFPRVTEGGTVVSGEGELVRGQVLGQITDGGGDDGKYGAYDSGAINGLEDPVAILGVDVDATSEDAVGTVYLSGHFKAESLTTFDDTIRATLRGVGIYVSGAAV
jgi:hypothetical protein